MIKVLHTSSELKIVRENEVSSIGFVPTMGNLHEGHLSLLTKAFEENDVVYLSIFVNPKQFGPNEDFQKYPRTFESDLEKIKTIANKFSNKKIYIFHPRDTSEIFPEKEDFKVEVSPLNNDLEGAIRPGHFDGVATVVFRLFKLIRPSISYFGLKDYQQYLVIKKMVEDLQLNIKIVGMPIIRDQDGLALSSRNQYLSSDERKASLLLSQSLLKLKNLIDGKSDNIPKAMNLISDLLDDKNWNYLEIRDSKTFSKGISFSDNITILGVYQLGNTRLLDNIQLEIE